MSGKSVSKRLAALFMSAVMIAGNVVPSFAAEEIPVVQEEAQPVEVAVLPAEEPCAVEPQEAAPVEQYAEEPVYVSVEEQAPTMEEVTAENPEYDAEEESAGTPASEMESGTAEPEKVYEPYIIFLPAESGVSYQGMDTKHVSGEFSTAEYTILLYEEGEKVSFTVSSDKKFEIMNAETDQVYVKSGDCKDGQVSFTMPAADLVLRFKVKAAVQETESSQEEIVMDVDELDDIAAPETVETEAEAETEAAPVETPVKAEQEEQPVNVTEAPEIVTEEILTVDELDDILNDAQTEETEATEEKEDIPVIEPSYVAESADDEMTEAPEEIILPDELEEETDAAEKVTEDAASEEVETENPLAAYADIISLAKAAYITDAEEKAESLTESETEAETEEVTEASEEETESETNTEVETESETETEEATEEVTETETETETEEATEVETDTESDAETEKETEIETEGFAIELDEYEIIDGYPDAGSTEKLLEIYVWSADTSFDVTTYNPVFTERDIADAAYASGEVDFSGIGNTYNIYYTATLKDDPTYSWTLEQPVIVTGDKSMASVESDDFMSMISLIHEQSDDYAGVVPERVGEHVHGEDIHVLVGEEFKLIDVDLGYDRTLFDVFVEDDGGFDFNTVGTYSVEYRIDSWEDFDVYWYVDCAVYVEEPAPEPGSITIHLESGEFKADIVCADGSAGTAVYGTDFVSAVPVSGFTVSSVYGLEIIPEISVMDGEDAVDKSELVASEVLTANVFTAVLNDTVALEGHAYVVNVAFPEYEEIAKKMAKMDRRGDDYYDLFHADNEAAPTEPAPEPEPVKSYTVSDEDGTIEFIEEATLQTQLLYAGGTSTKKTYTGSAAGSLGNLRGATNNSDGATGYTKATFTIKASTRTAIETWVEETLGASLVGQIPSTINIDCNHKNGQGVNPAWLGTGSCASKKLTVTAKKNNAGEWTKLVLSVYCTGAYSSRYGNYFQDFDGSKTIALAPAVCTLTLVKTSDVPDFLIKFTANVGLNARFGVYADQACTDLVDEIVIPTSGTSASRSVTLELDEAGTYYVKETVRPGGHASSSTVTKVVIGTGEDKQITIANHGFRFNGTILHKVDKNTSNAVPNAIYKVVGTAKNGTVGTWYFKTDANGNFAYDTSHYQASWNGNSSDPLWTYDTGKYGVPNLTTFACTEVQSPAGYVLDTTTYTKQVSMTDETQYVLTMTPIEVKESPDEGRLKLQKLSEATGTSTVPSSYYSLEGAVYEVFNTSGTKVGELTTGENGLSNELTLPTGKYSIKEKTASKNYELDTTVYSGTVTVNDIVTVTVKEKEKRGGLKIEKALDPDEPKALRDLRDLKQIIFSLSYKDNNSIDSETLNIDENGKGSIEGLLYGTWTISESTPLDYYKNIDPFDVIIDSDEVSEEYYVENLRKEKRITLQKKDIDSGNVVTLSNTTFQILDELGNKVSLSAMNRFGEYVVTDTFTTNSKGLVEFNQLIPGGKYYLSEITSPFGYDTSENVMFEITTDDNEDNTPIIIEICDQRQWGSIQVTKKDEDTGNVAGAGFKFDIIADEDILDGSGTAYTGYTAGSVIETITTGTDGVATSTAKLYIGKYHVEENTEIPAGYQHTNETYEFEITPDNAGKAAVPITTEFSDKPVMRPIKLLKLDKETGNGAGAGFVFEIKASEVKDGSGNVRTGYEAGTVVDTITTGSDSTATSKNLYCGIYTITEIQRGEGYLLGADPITVVVSDENKTTDPVAANAENVPLLKKIQVTKVDEKTGRHCGAGFVFDVVIAEDIVDGSGNVRAGLTVGTVVDTLTTGTDGVAVSKDLYLGSYYIIETAVPSDGGMALDTTQYPFTLSDELKDGKPVPEDEITFVVPLDDVKDKPTTLKITKKDTILDKVLEGVTFRIKEKGAADDDSQLYVTGAEGTILVEYLKAGTEYTIQEAKTIKGYNLNDEVYEFAVDANGQINGSWLYEITITNEPNVVQISKKDVTNDAELPGAHLVIKDSEGNVFDEWDSTDVPHEIYAMPSGRYTLTETIAPDLYEIENTITFDIVDSFVVQTVTMYDSPYRDVKFSKQDITTSKEIEGCQLSVLDESGNVVDSWTSGTEPHMLKLHSGKYTLREDRPADGYVTSDSINFEVIKTAADDYLVMPVVMKDDVTKITISKKDVTDGKEVPGAKLQIQDKDGNVVAEWISTEEPHYIERLPIGEYTLIEIAAPENYEIAESVKFVISDTPQIQHYEMKDAPYREVLIDKKELTGEKEVVGATLQVVTDHGDLVEEWISAEEPHKILLPSGKYILKETRPADGYVTATAISFEVIKRGEGDLEVQKVDMFDDVTKIEISKKDITTKKELPGAKLQILDEDGNIIEQWVSGTKPHYIEKLPIGNYILKEITAPDGYEVAEVVHFEVLDTGEIQPVVMFDAPKVTPTPHKDVKTGDTTQFIGWIVALFAALAAMVAAIILKRKRAK